MPTLPNPTYRKTNPRVWVAMKGATEEWTWIAGRRRLSRNVHRAHRKAGTLHTALALLGDKWEWTDAERALVAANGYAHVEA